MRRLCAPFALALLLAPSLASRAAAADIARPTADGWWDNAPAIVADPPQGSLGVGQSLGQVDRIAAVAVTLDLAPDLPIESLVIELKETGQQVVAGPPGIAACPISAAWTPAQGGAWAARPQAACDKAKAVGSRSPEGIWRFDITTIAQAWQSGSENQGIALVPEGASPATFDVALSSIASGGVHLSGRAGAASESEAVEGEPTIDFGTPTADLTFPPIDVPRAAPVPTVAPSQTAAPAPTVRPAAARPNRQGDVVGNLSPALFLLVPLVLGAALALALVLGPQGDPRGRRRREGGVSRALALRDSEVK